MAYCSSCGSELSGGEDFCPSCGESLGEEEDDGGHVVHVNVNQSADNSVQQSADQATSTAAAGDGDAQAGVDQEDSTEQDSGSSKEDSEERGDPLEYLAGIVLLGSIFGMLLSFIVGQSAGLSWVGLLTVPPYSFPFWLFGLFCGGVLYVSVKGSGHVGGS